MKESGASNRYMTRKVALEKELSELRQRCGELATDLQHEAANCLEMNTRDNMSGIAEQLADMAKGE